MSARSFRVYRTQVMDVDLSNEDIEEQLRQGETSQESARIIAESLPHASWTTCEMEVEER